MNIRALILGFAACSISATAFAQTAPVAAPVAPAPLAKHDCAKPALPDATKKLTTQEKNTAVKSLEAFRNCVRTFSDGQEKIKADREKEAKALQDSALMAIAAAKAAAAAVNAAVADYNELSQETVKRLNKDEPAPKSAGNTEAAPPRPSKNY